MTTPNMPADARAALAAYIASRDLARARHAAAEKLAQSIGNDFYEAFEFEGDDNDCIGLLAKDPDANRRMESEYEMSTRMARDLE